MILVLLSVLVGYLGSVVKIYNNNNMKIEKTFRDELAMSLDASLIPKITSETVMVNIAKKYNINLDLEDEISLIEFSLKYQCIIRYKFADTMLEVRKA